MERRLLLMQFYGPLKNGKNRKMRVCYLAGWVTVDAGILFPSPNTRARHRFPVDQSPETNDRTYSLPEILRPPQTHGRGVVTLDLGSFCRAALYLNTF